MEDARSGSRERKRKSSEPDSLEAGKPAPAAAEDQEPAGTEPAAEDQEAQRTTPSTEEEVGGGRSKRRKSAVEASEPSPAAEEGNGSEPAADDQEPPLPVADEGDKIDRISHLPDDVLGEIISLLPTKEGFRTQILATRWRHLWLSAPLNLDHDGLCKDLKDIGTCVKLILDAHPGPGRRFCVPVYHYLCRDHDATTTVVDAWLQSPALNNLQELQLCSFEPGRVLGYRWSQPVPPSAAFCFSDTLSVLAIGDCNFPDIAAQPIQFPKLKKLELDHVTISKSSLHTMITGCFALECLLIANSVGFSCVVINSITLKCICVRSQPNRGQLRLSELIIENAPCLEKLILLGLHDPVTSVISAPKLETLGWISFDYGSKLVLHSTIIQELSADSILSEMRTVKILAIHMHALCLDSFIGLLRFFPSLERLYIQSDGRGEANAWRRKHRGRIESLDLRLKRIVWRHYRGIKSHLKFATFFVLNARLLESMTFQVHHDDYNNEEFIAQQPELLQLNSTVSTTAQFYFTPDNSHRCVSDLHVHDLDLADPFELN